MKSLELGIKPHAHAQLSPQPNPLPEKCDPVSLFTQLDDLWTLRNYGSSSQTHKYYKLKERQQHTCSVPTVINSMQ